MKKTFSLLSTLLLAFGAFAQGLISGQVVDAETKQPLQGASVFAQNTTRGTITDSSGNFRLRLEKGGYELIISFTGYANRSINLEATGDRNFLVELQKADNSLGEVIIRNSAEVPDGWEKYGDVFLKYFIGATPNADSCTLLNPEVLKFLYYKRNDRIKVLATEPLQVVNRSLGYSLRYQLDSFVYYLGREVSSYQGYCFYSALEGSPEEAERWKEARREAYLGSRLHFLRAYYDSTLKRDGFSVDIQSERNPKQFFMLVNPYDSSYYYFDDAAAVAELWFPQKITVSYSKKVPEPEYLEQYGLPLDVKMQLSYVTLSDAIHIQPNGYFPEQRHWINEGYWSWKNLADQLPFDYELEE